MKLTFTGDAMCEHTRLADHYDRETDAYDFDDVFSGLSALLSRSDYTVSNLETPLAGETLGYSRQRYSFNTPSAFALSLRRAHVNLVTTANNHALDRGVEGLKNTLDQLDALGIEHTGTFANRETAHPFLKEIDGIRVAFLSYTYGTEACFNRVYLRKNEEFLVNLTRNQEYANPVRRFFLCSPSLPAKGFRFLYRTLSPEGAGKSPSDRRERDRRQKKHLLDDIAFCKQSGADFIVLCLHGGGQFRESPTAYMQRLCHFARDHGVDLAVGNHEHCIQAFDAEHKIAYCLGNLTSDYGIDRPPYDRLAEYSILLHVYLEKRDRCEIADCGFSVVKSVRDENHKIVTRLVSDLASSADPEEKERLRADVQRCIQAFLNRPANLAEIRDEYKLSEFGIRII